MEKRRRTHNKDQAAGFSGDDFDSAHTRGLNDILFVISPFIFLVLFSLAFFRTSSFPLFHAWYLSNNGWHNMAF